MHSEENPSRSEPAVAGVVVDIGADIGALVVYTLEQLNGVEIELSLAGDDRRTHTVVRPRRLAHRTVHAAVFPALAAGDYTLLGVGSIASSPVTIAGAAVTEVHW